MSNMTYQPIIVTGINGDDDSSDIVKAHVLAKELFEDDLVSNLSEVGHNFVQSFCVFPSGSGNEREAQMKHRASVEQFCEWLSTTDLDYVALKWTGDIEPEITHSHEDVGCRPAMKG